MEDCIISVINDNFKDALEKMLMDIHFLNGQIRGK